MNIWQALQNAQSQELERLDAQLLLLHALGRDAHDRAWLTAHDTDMVSAAAQTAFDALVQRRSQGEPLAYLTGTREFFGLSLQVDARVLDPRPDTETLVEWALEVLQDTPAPNVIDLGTGSGAIALALRHSRPDAHVYALDASAEALAVATKNARRLNLPVWFAQSNWLTDVSQFASARQPEESPGEAHDNPPLKFHAIVSNPPYIAQDDPHLTALTHEPLQALASGADGLQDIRQIINQASAHLLPGAWLLLEHGWDHAPTVRALLQGVGLTDVQSRRDLAGHERCSGGRAPR